MTGPVTDDQGTLSARQAALRAGIDERDLRRRIERGEVAAFKDGRTWRIRIVDLEAAGLTLHDEVGALVRRAESAERQVARITAERDALLQENAALRGQLAAAQGRHGLHLRDRFGLRRREPEYDWRVVGGLIETDGE
jgi:hypothetical protein